MTEEGDRYITVWKLNGETIVKERKKCGGERMEEERDRIETETNPLHSIQFQEGETGKFLLII